MIWSPWYTALVMGDFVLALQNVIELMKANMPFIAAWVGVLWAIHLVNWMVGYRLNVLGLYPRSIHGFIGIAFFSFLHGNFTHIFFNSIPLFVLGDLVLLSGHTIFYAVSCAIIVISGLAVWLFGRPAIHIGASSLIMGYFGFLLTRAYYQPSAVAVIVAIMCLYYFGGLALALVPGEKGVSWEGHVFGFLAGVAVAYYYPYLPTAIQKVQAITG